MIKFETSSEMRILKTCMCLLELDSFSIIADSDEIGGDANEFHFSYCETKRVDIWKIYRTQGIGIFQDDNAQCYELMCG